MTPTLTEINRTALDPYLEGDLPAKSALSTGSNTLKEFLVKNTRENDLSMFTDLIGDQGYEDHKDIPLTVILPAFTSELENCFSDRISTFSSIFSYRHGDCLDIDVFRNDDAEPNASSSSF